MVRATGPYVDPSLPSAPITPLYGTPWGTQPRQYLVSMLQPTILDTEGPALLNFVDVYTVGGVLTRDFGAIAAWANEGSGVPLANTGMGFIRSNGPYLYLPVAGRWSIRFDRITDFAGTATAIEFYVIDGPDPAWVQSLLEGSQSQLVSHSTTSQVVNPATATIVNIGPGMYGDAFVGLGRGLLHACGFYICNTGGANPVSLSIGTPIGAANNGRQLAPGATWDVPAGSFSMCSIYAFSTLGTNLAVGAYFR